MLHSHTFETANVYKSQSHFSFRFRLKIDQYFQFISNFEMFDVKTKYEKYNSTELPSFVCPVIYNITFFFSWCTLFFPLNGKKQKFVVELLVYTDI